MNQEQAFREADRVTRIVLPDFLKRTYGDDEETKIGGRIAALRALGPIVNLDSASKARRILGTVKSTLSRYYLGFTIGEKNTPEEHKRLMANGFSGHWLSSTIARAVWCASESVKLAMLDTEGEESTAFDTLSASCDYAIRVDELAN
jgi:hypothetical protein